jgi:hypothetical protein
MDTYKCPLGETDGCARARTEKVGGVVDDFETKKKYFALATAININAPISEITSERSIRHQHPYAVV